MSKGSEFDFVSPFFKVQEDVEGKLLSGVYIGDKTNSFTIGFEGKDFEKTHKYELERLYILNKDFEMLYLGYTFVFETANHSNIFIDSKGNIIYDNSLAIRRNG